MWAGRAVCPARWWLGSNRESGRRREWSWRRSERLWDWDIRLHADLAGDPIRDAGQQRLLDRFRLHLHESIVMTTEVPLPIEGDLRGWDAILRTRTWHKPVEAETVIDDVQAQERRLRLKMRDGGAHAVILLISYPRGNRPAIAAAPSGFHDFDRDARRVLADLRAGRDPGGSAILFL
jgi:hypothetical protein